MLPEYIKKKVERLNKMLADAYTLKSEIERWAEQNGIDTTCHEWYENVIDECSTVNGIYKEAFEEMINK